MALKKALETGMPFIMHLSAENSHFRSSSIIVVLNHIGNAINVYLISHSISISEHTVASASNPKHGEKDIMSLQREKKKKKTFTTLSEFHIHIIILREDRLIIVMSFFQSFN